MKVTPEIAAEAAIWVARLHGPGRNPRMEQECRHWQSRSPAHREAFERCTETWQEVPNIKLALAYESVAAMQRSRAAAPVVPPRSWKGWAAGALSAGALATAALFFVQRQESGAYETGIGEQRQVLLDDGSRMLLNTGTRLKVELGRERRSVSIARGEAIFEVAKDANRPFVVRAAGSEIVAVGTAFVVRVSGGDRSRPEALAVTLLEGKVKVQAGADSRGASLAPPKAVLLAAGERLALGHGSGEALVVQRVDRPNVDQVTAWKRNEAVFDDTSLGDAVAEMNRYSRAPITLQPDLAGLRVSGLYKAGDSEGFARAVAALHGLMLQEHGGRFELSRQH